MGRATAGRGNPRSREFRCLFINMWSNYLRLFNRFKSALYLFRLLPSNMDHTLFMAIETPKRCLFQQQSAMSGTEMTWQDTYSIHIYSFVSRLIFILPSTPFLRLSSSFFFLHLFRDFSRRMEAFWSLHGGICHTSIVVLPSTRPYDSCEGIVPAFRTMDLTDEEAGWIPDALKYHLSLT